MAGEAVEQEDAPQPAPALKRPRLGAVAPSAEDPAHGAGGTGELAADLSRPAPSQQVAASAPPGVEEKLAGSRGAETDSAAAQGPPARTAARNDASLIGGVKRACARVIPAHGTNGLAADPPRPEAEGGPQAEPRGAVGAMAPPEGTASSGRARAPAGAAASPRAFLRAMADLDSSASQEDVPRPPPLPAPPTPSVAPFALGDHAAAPGSPISPEAQDPAAPLPSPNAAAASLGSGRLAAEPAAAPGPPASLGTWSDADPRVVRGREMHDGDGEGSVSSEPISVVESQGEGDEDAGAGERRRAAPAPARPAGSAPAARSNQEQSGAARAQPGPAATPRSTLSDPADKAALRRVKDSSRSGCRNAPMSHGELTFLVIELRSVQRERGLAPTDPLKKAAMDRIISKGQNGAPQALRREVGLEQVKNFYRQFFNQRYPHERRRVGPRN